MVEATNHHPAVGPVRQVDAGLLNVGYADIGPADGRVAVLLHGWPYDIHSYGEQAAPALDVIALLDALQVEPAILAMRSASIVPKAANIPAPSFPSP
jgi:pimeloyl-ACP methyl ester carboxylesterase